MKKKCMIKVMYYKNGKEDTLKIDKKIEEVMEKIGAIFYGNGFNFSDNTRDIVFNWKVEVES